MWENILVIFSSPWMYLIVFFVAPLLYAWFNLGPSKHKHDDTFDLQTMIDKKKRKLQRKELKKKAKEERKSIS